MGGETTAETLTESCSLKRLSLGTKADTQSNSHLKDDRSGIRGMRACKHILQGSLVGSGLVTGMPPPGSRLIPIFSIKSEFNVEQSWDFKSPWILEQFWFDLFSAHFGEVTSPPKALVTKELT